MSKDTHDRDYQAEINQVFQVVTQDVALRQKALLGGVAQLRDMLKTKTCGLRQEAQALIQHARYQTLFDNADAESLLEYLKKKEEVSTEPTES